MPLKKYFPLIGSLLLVVVNLFLINLPLFRYFSFEFAVANAIVISFLSGWFYLMKVEKKYYFMALLVPIVFGVFLYAKYEMCSFIDGMEYYFVFTLPSALIGAGLGAFANLNCSKIRFILYPVVFFAALFAFAIEIYFRPNIYFFNPIIGFFPGTIYDESLQLGWKHYSYRFLNITFFSSIIFFDNAKPLKPILQKWSYLIFIFIGIAFYFLKPVFGYSTDEQTLENVLRQKIETQNFIIRTSQPLSEEDEKYFKRLHEFYFKELKTFFQSAPKAKINSYIFTDEIEKRELIGAGNADIAKPWRSEIYLNLGAFERSLKHEIAHVFAAEFSSNFFKVPASFNSALIEGLAVAAENYYSEEEIYSLVNLARKNDFGVKIVNLFSGLNFFGQSSGRSYLFAGAFLKYLNEKYGIEKIRRIYDDLTFEETYGKNIERLETEFISALDSIQFENNRAKAEYYFGRKPIIQKICPRFFANKTEEVFQSLAKKDFMKADAVLSDLLVYSQDYNLILAKLEVFKHQNKLDDAEKFLASNLNKHKGTPYYYLLQLQLADILSLNQKQHDARLIYDALISAKSHLRITHIASLRNSLMRSLRLRNYLATEDSLKHNYLLDSLNSADAKFAVPSLLALEKYFSARRLKEFAQRFIATADSTDYDWNYSALKLCDALLHKNLAHESETLFRMINGVLLRKSFGSFYTELGMRINYFAQ